MAENNESPDAQGVAECDCGISTQCTIYPDRLISDFEKNPSLNRLDMFLVESLIKLHSALRERITDDQNKSVLVEIKTHLEFLNSPEDEEEIADDSETTQMILKIVECKCYNFFINPKEPEVTEGSQLPSGGVQHMVPEHVSGHNRVQKSKKRRMNVDYKREIDISDMKKLCEFIYDLKNRIEIFNETLNIEHIRAFRRF